MYNMYDKNRFIEHYANNKTVRTFAEKVFNAFCETEVKHQRDIYSLNSNHIMPVIAELCNNKKITSTKIILFLREYVEWCKCNLTNRDDGLCLEIYNEVFTLRPLEKDVIRGSYVANPIHLNQKLDDMFGCADERMVSIVYRCFAWLAFMGVDEDHILELTPEHVDFVNMRVFYNGWHYPLYQESVDDFKNAVSLKEFQYYHPLYANMSTKKRVDGDCILRGVSNPTITRLRNSLREACIKISADATYKTNLLYSSIQRSGMFYQKYEQERAGIRISFMPEAKKICWNENVKTDDMRVIESRTKTKAKELQDEYMSWRLTFSL